MRNLVHLLPFAAGALASVNANAQEVSVALASRYLDTETYDDVFSDSPMVMAEVEFGLTDSAYVSAYAYTGFKKPFADESSEYGLEVGKEVPIAPATTLTLAAGRYANYEGQGFDAGDWYAKAQVAHGPLTASASVLKGDVDSVLLHVEYRLPAGEKLTVTPSATYFTRDGRFNPGVSAEYQLNDRFSLTGMLVMPQNEETGKRGLFAGVSLSYSF